VGAQLVIVDPPTLAVFAGAALALLVVPGPAVLYIVARSVHQGRSAGLAAVVGIHLGTLAHVFAATLGLSAVLASSATAFTTVKLVGAFYLVYLGVRTLLGRGVLEDPAQPVVRRRRQDVAEGILVNVLNPKTALFFLAFLPQFVDPEAGHPALQVLALGCVFMLLGAITDSLWALGAGAAGESLQRHRAWPRAQRYVSGSVFIGLGAIAAIAHGPRAT
jgi:threonine/homoserine/homoserine lactone efflux protein